MACFFARAMLDLQLHRPMSRTRKELLVVIVVDKVAVGTIIADRPPHRSARALISACGSYLG
jgi:hypothetical protein